jgi:transketolase
VGTEGAIVAMSTFGESAPLKALQGKFGFTPEAVAQTARDQIARHRTTDMPMSAPDHPQ